MPATRHLEQPRRLGAQHPVTNTQYSAAELRPRAKRGRRGAKGALEHLSADLPWPDPGLIDKWWYTHRRDFLSGTRYLVGNPISFAWLQDVLRHGRQRQRAAAALELAMRQPGQPLFEVRAPGFRQQQLLRANR